MKAIFHLATLLVFFGAFAGTSSPVMANTPEPESPAPAHNGEQMQAGILNVKGYYDIQCTSSTTLIVTKDKDSTPEVWTWSNGRYTNEIDTLCFHRCSHPGCDAMKVYENDKYIGTVTGSGVPPV